MVKKKVYEATIATPLGEFYPSVSISDTEGMEVYAYIFEIDYKLPCVIDNKICIFETINNSDTSQVKQLVCGYEIDNSKYMVHESFTGENFEGRKFIKENDVLYASLFNPEEYLMVEDKLTDNSLVNFGKNTNGIKLAIPEGNHYLNYVNFIYGRPNTENDNTEIIIRLDHPLYKTEKILKRYKSKIRKIKII